MHKFQKWKAKIENLISTHRFITPKSAMFHWNIGFGSKCVYAFNQIKNSFPRTLFLSVSNLVNRRTSHASAKSACPYLWWRMRATKTKGTTTTQLIDYSCEVARFDSGTIYCCCCCHCCWYFVVLNFRFVNSVNEIEIEIGIRFMFVHERVKRVYTLLFKWLEAKLCVAKRPI